MHGDYADLRFQGRKVTVRRAGAQDIAGVPTVLYDARTPTPVAGRPASLPVDQVARLNGGRLPLGVSPAPDGTVPVQYTGARVFTVALEPRTGRVVDVRGTETVTAAAVAGEDVVALADPVSSASNGLPTAARNQAAATAATAIGQLDDRLALGRAALACLLLAGPALLGALALTAAARRTTTPTPAPQPDPAGILVES